MERDIERFLRSTTRNVFEEAAYIFANYMKKATALEDKNLIRFHPNLFEWDEIYACDTLPRKWAK